MKLMTTISASLGSPAFFTPSLFALQNANNQLATSAGRLASGNRILNASDDVASLSIATRLQSQLSGLKQASRNLAQGNSLLQVAQGGLSQISDLLDLMNSVAVQANSSSLTSTDRTYLQQQFQAYQEEIDRIASNTEFNNISLLDGMLSGANKALTQTTAATKASGSLTFTSNLSNTNTVVLNGVTFTAGTDFAVGGSIDATIDNLVTALSASTDVRISQAKYTRSSTGVLTITAKSGGTLGNQFIIDEAASTGAAAFTVSAGSTQVANVFTLTGGLDNGLAFRSVKGTGTIGDSLVTAQVQTSGSVTLTISGTVSDGETLRIDNGNGSYRDFTFRTSASSSTEIQIGSTTEETLQNIVAKLTQYSGTDNYGIRQLEYTVSGSTLIITNKNVGNPTDLSGNVLDIAETMTNGSLSAATITGGTTTGINTSGVNNGDFIGTIAGFSATYNSADNITLSLTVGEHTYTATVSDTTPVAATTVRFSSTSGGFFDVQIAASGAAVTNQTTADTFASRLNSAFAGITFYQDRPVSNFTATGSFIGASSKLQLGDFTDVRFDSITVTAPNSTDATIDITINGEVFRASAGIGGKLGAYETIKFTNVNNSNEFLTLTNGSTAQDFSTSTAAATFQTALRTAYGLGEEGEGVDFQVGVNSDDVVNVVVDDVRFDTLFNGSSPSVATQAGAAAAQTLIDTAKVAVQTAIAAVGAIQTRFDYASRNIDTTIEGITAARSNLTDTDIPSEATEFAQATLRINAGVAVIAQARNLQSSLLGVLQFGGK